MSAWHLCAVCLTTVTTHLKAARDRFLLIKCLLSLFSFQCYWNMGHILFLLFHSESVPLFFALWLAGSGTTCSSCSNSLTRLLAKPAATGVSVGVCLGGWVSVSSSGISCSGSGLGVGRLRRDASVIHANPRGIVHSLGGSRQGSVYLIMYLISSL